MALLENSLKPSASSYEALYTVPALKEAALSSVTVCNLSTTPDTFRVTRAPNGAVTEDKQHIYYNLGIPGNETFTFSIGLTATAATVIRVWSTNGTLAFNLSGKEYDA